MFSIQKIKNYDFSDFKNPKLLLGFWLFLSLLIAVKQYLLSTPNRCYFNNFKIFYSSYGHLLAGNNLYKAYNEYFDLYLYGPVFAVFMAPFYHLPELISLNVWVMLNALVLFVSLWKLPLNDISKVIIIWIVTNNMITNALNVQFHSMCIGLIILSFVYIEKNKDIWATLLIVLGVFIKIYGVVGFAFFFFSKDKKKFILYSILWTIVILILPLIVASPDYLIQCYKDWFEVLTHKNTENILSPVSRYDLCVMGVIRKFTGNYTLSNLYFIIPALVITCLSYFNFKNHELKNYRIALLASLTMLIILSSTGSETPTYIMAFPGIGIWFVLEREKTWGVKCLLIVALVVTSFSPTDLFPQYIRTAFVNKYALMVIPVFIIWIRINYLMITARLKEV